MDWRRYCVIQGDEMKAIVFTKYGSAKILQLKEVAKPVHGDAEVLIKIHAATVTDGDVTVRG
jgi:NADPH:quinone reductase-like Zn-dependent oxidoreductase